MIEITEVQYETLWETIEVLQKDKLHMQKVHGEFIDKIMKLNTIIFDLKLENTTLQPLYSGRELEDKLKEQKEITKNLIEVSFNLGQEILEKDTQTGKEQKFLDQLDSILELIEKGNL